MGVEQGPKPLGELRRRLNRFDRAADRVGSMINDPGGDSWPQRLNLNGIPDSERYLETAVRVGEITERLKIRTQPILEQKRYGVYSEIEDRISQIEENVRRIAELADQGIYGVRGEEILTRAQEALRRLRGEDTQPVREPREKQKEGQTRENAPDRQAEEGRLFSIRDIAIAIGHADNTDLVYKRVKKAMGSDPAISDRYFIKGKRRGALFLFNEADFNKLVEVTRDSPTLEQGEVTPERDSGNVLNLPQYISTDGLTRREPSGQKLEGDQAAQEVFQTNRTYGTTDLIKEVCRLNPTINKATIRTRIERAINNDPSLGPSNAPHRGRGGERLFTGAVAGRLAEEARNPSKKRWGREASQKPGRSREPADDDPFPASTIGSSMGASGVQAVEKKTLGRLGHDGHSGDQNEVSKEKKDRMIRAFGIDLTRAVLSQLADVFGVELFRKLPNDVLALTRPFLPQGTDLQSITGIGSPDGLNEFAVGLIVVVVEEFWDADEKQLIGAGRIVSVKEKQIIDYCVRLKEKGHIKPGVIETVCNHFSVPLLEKYREVRPTLNSKAVGFDGGSNSGNREQGRGDHRGSNWDRLGQQGSKPPPYVPPQGRIPSRWHTRGFRRT